MSGSDIRREDDHHSSRQTVRHKKDIQTYKSAHAMDMKRKSKTETAVKARKAK